MDLRPRDQSVLDRDHVLHETEAETKTNYYEIETETKIKKVVRDHAAGLETLISLL